MKNMRRSSAVLILSTSLSVVCVSYHDGRMSIIEVDYPIVSSSVICMDLIPSTRNRVTSQPHVHPRPPVPSNLSVNEDEQSHEIYEVVNYELIHRLFLRQSFNTSRSFLALQDSMRVIPPDTQGAVGLQHLMTTLSDRICIQDKTGNSLKMVDLGTFWNLGSSDTPFDPRVTFDPFSQRWIFSTTLNPQNSDAGLLIAVSQTSNPMGNWKQFRIKADQASRQWADNPSLGFNKKWIVLQANLFGINDNSFGSRVYVLNKAQLYAGNLGTVKTFTLNNMGGSQVPAITYDNSLESLYFVQDWNGSLNGKGYLRVYALNGAVGSETFGALGLVTVNTQWASSTPESRKGFAPQSQTNIRIDNNDSRIQGVVYRNGSLWIAHGVFLPLSSPSHSLIQWWQITPDRKVQQFGRIEDPMANLNRGTFYAFPSIAVNMNNDVLIGYSYFGPTLHASAGYSVRLGTDPINTMRTPMTLKLGLGIYTKDFGSGEVRWGDYSSSCVDPTNDRDMWTLQEYADSVANGTSRWATWWGLVNY